jgi:2-(1,2-epoxy-1,2-dihydrophenyl)acetyl-CoA isomerase
MIDTFEHITVAIDQGVARLMLNRPQVLNALSQSMLAEIVQALDEVRDGKQARVLVISGAGRGFCSGNDMTEGGASTAADRRDSGAVLERFYNPMIERLFALPIPIVAAVHGAVAGAGCMLALSADFVLAGNSAYFLQAFVNIGLVPDAGSFWLLPRIVGRQRAHAMMMLGEKIPAETALAWGLIFKVVPDGELQAEAGRIAAKLGSGPTRAYGLIRQGVRAGMEQSLSQTLVMERALQCLAGRTEDYAEGVAAFRAKRPAQFKGR